MSIEKPVHCLCKTFTLLVVNVDAEIHTIPTFFDLYFSLHVGLEFASTLST